MWRPRGGISAVGLGNEVLPPRRLETPLLVSSFIRSRWSCANDERLQGLVQGSYVLQAATDCNSGGGCSRQVFSVLNPVLCDTSSRAPRGRQAVNTV